LPLPSEITPYFILPDFDSDFIIRNVVFILS